MTSITEKGLEMRMDPFACYMSKVPRADICVIPRAGNGPLADDPNQALASCATLEAPRRCVPVCWLIRRNIIMNGRLEARKEAVQGHVFDTRSKSVLSHFLENMARHHIEVYQLAKDHQAAGNKEFQKRFQPIHLVAQNTAVRWLCAYGGLFRIYG